MNAPTRQPARLDQHAVASAITRPRPLLLPTLAFITGIVLSEYVGSDSRAVRAIAFALPILALFALLACAVRRVRRAWALHGLLIIAALGVGYARHQREVRLPPNHVAHFLGDEPILTRLAGRIVTQPTTFPAEKRNPFLPYDPPPQTRFVLAAQELRTTESPVPVAGYIRVGVEARELDVQLGEEVLVTGWLYRPFGPRNPGETDWARWNRLQQIYAGLSVEGAVHVRRVEADETSVHRWIASLRGYAQSLLFEPFAQIESDQPLRLLDAMVLGHRSAAGRTLNEAFLRTGSIHFLTVSGFHVGVLAGAVWLLVRRVLRRDRRVAALATMIAIVLYALTAEHNAPVLRAATMGILLCVAQLAGRPLCGLNWLAFSALCILAYNPLELFRAGFQLSFVQVLALFTIVPHLYKLVIHRRADEEVPADADTYPRLFARGTWRWAAGLIVVCVCAWIVSLPLVLFHFGRFAPWGALQAILVSPVVMLTIVLGFFTLIGLAIVPPLGVVLGVLLRNATDLLLWVVAHLSQLPGTLLEIRRPPVLFVVLIYAGLLAFIWGWRPSPAGSERLPADGRRRSRRGFGTLLAAALITIGLGSIPLRDLARPDGLSIHVLSVGSGAAALMTTPQGDAALFDAGTMHNFDVGQTVVQAAHAVGVRRLDLLAISHANFDHYSGTATVLTKLAVERLLFNPYFEAAADNVAVRLFLGSLPVQSPPRGTLRAGDRLTLGETDIEVLWPPDDLDENWQPNDRSLVLRVSAHGHSVIIPGDIERAALRGLLALHGAGRVELKADVLIAPHHGAVVPMDTAAFYQAVDPEVVISSTSRERPKLAKMLDEIAGEPIRLISTREVGAVSICMRADGSLRVGTPFAPDPQ